MLMSQNEATEKSLEDMFDLGYDSDGEMPYFGDAEWEKALLE